jgi:hypothetical protein
MSRLAFPPKNKTVAGDLAAANLRIEDYEAEPMCSMAAME